MVDQSANELLGNSELPGNSELLSRSGPRSRRAPLLRLGGLVGMLLLAMGCLATPSVAWAQARGLRDQPVFPKNPPPALRIRIRSLEGVSQTLPGVPEYHWWYGCSPTAAGMVIGWWDAQVGCTDLFAGDASTWWGAGDGSTGTKRLVASKEDIDAGKALGLTYGSYQNHTANCLADFMQTENGGTYRDYIGPGLVGYCSWNDPTDPTKGSYTASAITKYVSGGWTYAQFCAEIDAGRPVHLGLRNASNVGHSVTAIGYDNTDGKQNYICWTTWGGWGVRSWGWTGETESGYNFAVYGATYLTVTPKVTNHPPTAPTTASIAPTSPVTTSNLIATASGSTDADGDSLSYEYGWARSTDSGGTWSSWGWSGATLAHANTTKNERWKVRARAGDGKDTSVWVEGAAVTIANSAPSAPTTATVSPTSPVSTDDLTAGASGATDADGDSLSYECQWARSTDGGSTWSSWGWPGTTLAHTNTSKGEQWKARARANDGTATSAWRESSSVAIANASPTIPSSVVITPGPRALDDQNLTVTAAGSTDADGDSLQYAYQWWRSTDGGTNWTLRYTRTSSASAALDRSLTMAGERWKVRAAATDGHVEGPTSESAVVIINTPATAPGSLVIAPSPQAGGDDTLTATASGSTDAEGDSLRYVYQWCKSTDGGLTWGAWGWTTVSSTTARLDKSLTSAGEKWKVRSAANDGYQTGSTTEGPTVSIATVPTAPASVTITPGPRALVGQNLTAAAAGATSSDGSNLLYTYQWAKSTDGGGTWSDWGWQVSTPRTSALSRTLTSAGDRWKARAAASDAHGTGAWLESAVVTVNTPATAPSSVAISPAPQAGDNDSLTATASGSTDAEGDSLRYVYQWCKSTDGGVTWGAWGWTTTSTTGATLDKSLTSAGDRWKVRSAANDGYQTGAPTESAAVEAVAAVHVASVPLAVMASAAVTRDQNVAITVNLTAAAEVGASVLNLAGREVAVIPTSRLAAGISTVWWNGRSVSGTRVPAGQYLLRLQARSSDGSDANCLVPLRR
jgi:hypothetical protein